MINRQNLKLYLAVKNAPEHSQMEDTLVLDGFDIRTFPSARELRSRSLVGMRWLNYLDSLTAPKTKKK